MLGYCLSGIGIIFFLLITGSNESGALVSLGDSPAILQIGIVALANLAIMVALGHDCLNRRRTGTHTTIGTLGGIGILIFLLLTDNNRTFINTATTLPPIMQFGIASIPLVALIASLISDFMGARRKQSAKAPAGNKGEKGFTLIELLIIVCILAIISVVAVPAFIKYSQRQTAEKQAIQSHLLSPTEMSRLKQSASTHEIPLKNLIFFRDERSGLCFAYAWVGAGNGGPAMAAVSCEIVEGMLLNPRPSNSAKQPDKPGCPPDCEKQ